MEVRRKSSWLFLLLGLLCLTATLQGVQGEVESEGPSESECRPFIEKALKELETAEAIEPKAPGDTDGDSKEDAPTVEVTTDDSDQEEDDGDNDDEKESAEDVQSVEDTAPDSGEDPEGDKSDEEVEAQSAEDEITQENEADESKSAEAEDEEAASEQKESAEEETPSTEDEDKPTESTQEESKESGEETLTEQVEESTEDDKESVEDEKEQSEEEGTDKEEEKETESTEDKKESTEVEGEEETEAETVADSQEHSEEVAEEEHDSKEGTDESAESEQTTDDVKEDVESAEDDKAVAEDEASIEEVTDNKSQESDEKVESQENVEDKSEEQVEDIGEAEKQGASEEHVEDKGASEEHVEVKDASEEHVEDKGEETAYDENVTKSADAESEEKKEDEKEESEGEGSDESAPEEDLINADEIPDELRPTDHISQLLKLNDENEGREKIIDGIAEIILRDLKRLYENAIKPLEVLYKYRDLSNRHFGDAEIFSKPLVLFMGPWSGGKSSIINYLLDNEYNETSLRTGAEPSPAYFNILMYGEETEVIDGTQLAADFTFSGLQKFGQGLEERLRGLKLPKKLLEKINLVEIPGILEVRKQVSRVFPFNDACQWFIDRADIIFLVYDPSKLDVGPETEAILDQLKGREHQTRIILNKADQVKPEELMRVQGALIWNISPLMSSAQPPAMYTTSLWSRPYESWAPIRLLQAQERAFLRDLRSAIDKRIENKISSARRFAVRVRNHAKMVDCYLTTYYNHKSVFGNRKEVSNAIIEHPQDYHIYEGLSTLTNISRYDLPDPDVYRDFFRLNPLYDFQQLSATCTYFRGCPINRLDVAIAYDLPELVGKYKRLVEAALADTNQTQAPDS